MNIGFMAAAEPHWRDIGRYWRMSTGAGGHLIRILPAPTVRRIVIVAGVAMTTVYADRHGF